MVEDPIMREKKHDLASVVTGIDRAESPRTYLSKVIAATPCDIACAFGWSLAMAKRELL
jgi:hypothetical protein